MLQVENVKIFLTQKICFPHDSKISSFLNLTPHDLSTYHPLPPTGNLSPLSGKYTKST